MTAVDKCVIRKRSVRDWSKGGSDTEFGAYTTVDDATFDLNKAYRFEIMLEGPTADPHIEGPAVACSPDGACSNSWSKQIFPEDYYSYDVRSPSVLRRDKALEQIKKVCQGKPY